MLALRQSEIVAEGLRSAHAGLAVELVTFVTRGDRRRGPLSSVGGKGLFTAELGAALREGASVEELQSIAVQEGMITMAADGVRKAAEGRTALREVLRVLALR